VKKSKLRKKNKHSILLKNKLQFYQNNESKYSENKKLFSSIQPPFIYLFINDFQIKSIRIYHFISFLRLPSLILLEIFSSNLFQEKMFDP